MNIGEKFRLKTMAKYAFGKKLDIGFNAIPNPFLTNVDGIDILITNHPANYNELYTLDKNSCYPIKSNVYDTVLAGEVIEHVLNLEDFFSEINRVLKKKGRLILSTPNPVFYSYIIFTIFNLWDKNHGKRGDHVHLFCLADIYTLANIYGYKVIEIKSAYWQFLGFKIPLFFNFLKFLSFQIIYILEKK